MTRLARIELPGFCYPSHLLILFHFRVELSVYGNITEASWNNPHIYTSFPLAFCLPLCQHVVMVCIYCSGKTDVTNSRPQRRLNHVWRRRKCHSCGALFTSIEAAELATSVLVLLPDGQRAPFNRDRLLVSIISCLGHRSDAIESGGYLTATIIAKLLRQQKALIETRSIVEAAHITLAAFDTAAATQYAAYHPLSRAS
jgi:transcriptional repressor NrdR